MFFLAFLNTIKISLENSILKYGLKRKGTSRLFRVVLGPCEQCCPCEAMEQNGAKN